MFVSTTWFQLLAAFEATPGQPTNMVLLYPRPTSGVTIKGHVHVPRLCVPDLMAESDDNNEVMLN
jgi:hypothetical protein